MNLHTFSEISAPLTATISRPAFYAALQQLTRRLPAAPRVYCQDSLCLAVAILACAAAGVDIELLPRPDKPNLSDADILPCIRPAAAAALPVLQDIRLILYTSGSTGAGKAVVKSLSAMLEEGQMLRRLLADYPASGQILAAVSPQHLYGLSFAVFLPLLSGRQFSRQQYRYPELLLDATANAHLPCLWLTTPALLHTLTAAYPVKQWRKKPALIVSAGGALAQETAQQLRQIVQVADIYGSSETGVIAADFGQGRQILPEVQTRRDEQGILHVNSPWSGGWQCTGDVVSADLQLLGRADRMIKRGDKRLSADALEHTLNEQPGIADSYCALHPDTGRLCAWVALNPDGIERWRKLGRKTMLRAWQQALTAKYDRVANIRHFRITDALPRNAQGKIARKDFLTVLSAPVTAPVWQTPEYAGDKVIIRGRVPADLIYFNGHFERIALVPGVVQCRWVLQLAAQHFPLSGCISSIEHLKFRRFLRPFDQLSISLSRQAARGKLYFSCDNGAGQCATGRIVYTEALPTPAADASFTCSEPSALR